MDDLCEIFVWIKSVFGNSKGEKICGYVRNAGENLKGQIRGIIAEKLLRQCWNILSRNRQKHVLI